MKKNTTAQGYLLNTIVLVVLFVGMQVLTSVLGGNSSFKLVLAPCLWQCCYLIILAASLNLVLGFLGQLSLGHCGFMAIGAYTAALLSLACERAEVFTDNDQPVFLVVLFACILAGGLLSALVGLLVGIPALRLKGDYLAIITLGFGMIIVNIINNLPFCGQDGLSLGSASASLYKNGLGFGTKAKVTFLWVAILVAIVCMTQMFLFIRSKYGRAIRAIRDDEIAASASGINTSFYKVMTFVYSAFFAGVAGALYACANATLSTSSFAFTNSGSLKPIAPLNQVSCQFPRVIHLSVINNSILRTLGPAQQRLRTAGQIPDGKSCMREPHSFPQVFSRLIRSPVGDRFPHLHQNVLPPISLIQKILLKIAESCNSAHANHLTIK